nr:hypothetical protein GCM10020063_040560 [Dactylosporangium thailandense]
MSYPSLRDVPVPVDIVNVFRAPDALPGLARDAVATGAGTLRTKSGVINAQGAQIAEDGGLTVVVDRCLKFEHARYVGRMHWLGVQHPAHHVCPGWPAVAVPAQVSGQVA